jgi:hypothetical protein
MALTLYRILGQVSTARKLSAACLPIFDSEAMLGLRKFLTGFGQIVPSSALRLALSLANETNGRC